MTNLHGPRNRAWGAPQFTIDEVSDPAGHQADASARPAAMPVATAAGAAYPDHEALVVPSDVAYVAAAMPGAPTRPTMSPVRSGRTAARP